MPLLAIVVKPLNASMPNAVAPRKLPAVLVSPNMEESIAKLSASQTPTKPKMRIPTIFIIPINDATPWIQRLLSKLIKNAARISAAPRTDTMRPLSSPPNNCIVYDPNVRARKLCAITMEKYISKALKPVGKRSPYA